MKVTLLSIHQILSLILEIKINHICCKALKTHTEVSLHVCVCVCVPHLTMRSEFAVFKCTGSQVFSKPMWFNHRRLPIEFVFLNLFDALHYFFLPHNYSFLQLLFLINWNVTVLEWGNSGHKEISGEKVQLNNSTSNCLCFIFLKICHFTSCF